MGVVVERVVAATEEVRGLVSALDAELGAGYPVENRHGLSLEKIFRAGVEFFVARVEGEAVGCGGVALGEEGWAEVKRMYVRPGARGKGVGRAILVRIEAAARGRGCGRLVLETGDGQLAAMRLYEGFGFRRCGAFGAYAGMGAERVGRSVFFEKAIG